METCPHGVMVQNGILIGYCAVCRPAARKVYIIETPPTASEYKCCPAMLSESELKEAKQERPDLIFTVAGEGFEVESTLGTEVDSAMHAVIEKVISQEPVTGMSFPALKVK